eukprot:scaffold59824_cov49-Prasinocladus_malaysianus.AAC.1
MSKGYAFDLRHHNLSACDNQTLCRSKPHFRTITKGVVRLLCVAVRNDPEAGTDIYVKAEDGEVHGFCSGKLVYQCTDKIDLGPCVRLDQAIHGQHVWVPFKNGLFLAIVLNRRSHGRHKIPIPNAPFLHPLDDFKEFETGFDYPGGQHRFAFVELLPLDSEAV